MGALLKATPPKRLSLLILAKHPVVSCFGACLGFARVPVLRVFWFCACADVARVALVHQKGTHKRAFFSTRVSIGVGGLKTRLHMLMQRYRPNGRTLAGNTPKAAVTLDPSGSQEEPSAPSASSSGYTGPALSAEWLLLPKRELKAENMPPLKSKLSLI